MNAPNPGPAHKNGYVIVVDDLYLVAIYAGAKIKTTPDLIDARIYSTAPSAFATAERLAGMFPDHRIGYAAVYQQNVIVSPVHIVPPAS